MHPVVLVPSLAEARHALRTATIAILLDVHLASPDGVEDGFELLRELRAERDPTPVLMMTGDGQLAHANEATRLDAKILYKIEATDGLSAFVADALARPRKLDVFVALNARRYRFTPREVDACFAMLRRGSVKEIADELGVMSSGAKKLINSTLHKMGLRERVELIRRFPAY